MARARKAWNEAQLRAGILELEAADQLSFAVVAFLRRGAPANRKALRDALGEYDQAVNAARQLDEKFTEYEVLIDDSINRLNGSSEKDLAASKQWRRASEAFRREAAAGE